MHDILAAEGTDGLTELPGIGRSLARSLERLAKTGRLALLEQLRGVYGPEEKLATVPGIGPKTAARIHQALGIETLADLQAAAYDGRLAHVPGMGRSGLRAVRESLPADSAAPAPPDRSPAGRRPRDPRSRSRRGSAERRRRIPPQGTGRPIAADCTAAFQSDPQGVAADPAHAPRGDHEYTALYSNYGPRSRARRTLCDWVVIYRTPAKRRGPMDGPDVAVRRPAGRRIIRGLETECADHYARLAPPANSQHLRRVPCRGVRRSTLAFTRRSADRADEQFVVARRLVGVGEREFCHRPVELVRRGRSRPASANGSPVRAWPLARTRPQTDAYSESVSPVKLGRVDPGLVVGQLADEKVPRADDRPAQERVGDRLHPMLSLGNSPSVVRGDRDVRQIGGRARFCASLTCRKTASLIVRPKQRMT